MISIRRKKVKNIILGFLITSLIMLMAIIVYRKGYLGDAINAIKKEKTEKNIINGIQIDEINLVYNSDEDTYYFPINLEKSKEEKLTIKIQSNHFLKTEIEGKQFSKTISLSKKEINYNTAVEIRVESLLYKDNCKIKFTNMPIISINYNEEEIGTEYVQAGFSIIDPDYKENNTKHQFSSVSKVRYRGSSTLEFPKKSYRIKIKENMNFGLLGMNQNNTWILDPMVTDSSKIRTKISSDLWYDINKDLDSKKYAKLNTKYAEVYVNGSYNGLYLLKEVVDENLLDLNKDTGVLIKGVNWNLIDFNNYDKIEEETYGPFELKYPENESQYSKSWNNILDKLKMYYHENIEELDSNPIFYSENLTNHKIFLMTLNAIDNYEFKNVYYSIQDDKEDTKVLITPWDLDITWGMTVNDELWNVEKGYDEVEKIAPVSRIKEFERNKETIKKRWQFLSQKVLSKDEINQKIDKQYEELTKAGALERENRKHNNTESTENEVKEIKDWYDKRFDVVEQYIKSL